MRKTGLILLALTGCASMQPPALPDSKNRVVDIVNTTARAVRFKAVQSEHKGLIPPRPLTGTIAAQSYQTFNFDDQSGTCLFDFTAKINGQSPRQHPAFNTCDAAVWVIK